MGVPAILRPLTLEHLSSLLLLERDSAVTEWLGGASSDELVEQRLLQGIEHFARHGWGEYAIHNALDEFVGTAGLRLADADRLHNGVEALWRLRSAAWGRGYVTAAMSQILEEFFAHSGYTEVFAVTSTINARSRGVMHRLGFVFDSAGTFLHPKLPPTDPLAPHVTYRYAPHRSV